MRRILATAIAGTLVIAACTEVEMPRPDEGRLLFAEYCTACHGASGTGDGPLADSLSTAPADLTRISQRNGGTFPHAAVLSQIDGYARSGPDGPEMPEFGLLLDGDTVPYDAGDGTMTPTPRKLAALAAYLQSIQTAP